MANVRKMDVINAKLVHFKKEEIILVKIVNNFLVQDVNSAMIILGALNVSLVITECQKKKLIVV